MQVNFEGTAGGDYPGTTIVTATFVGSKSGTYQFVTAAYLDNGDEVSFTGNGTYESADKHHWRTQHPFHGSDGSSGVTEGEIDLATRTWTGKSYEKG
jgi:hypothetical protein